MRKVALVTVGFVLAFAWRATLLAQSKVLPVDEAAKSPDFFAFRARLQAAIARHDADAVMAVVDANIKNSFGGNGGVEEFKEMWTPEKPDSRLWETLATVLALGGTLESDRLFIAPYLFSRWPKDKDSYDCAALIGAQVALHEEPRADSKVLATMDFAVLDRDHTGQPGVGWVALRLPGGRRAYARKSYVRSPIDYRAFFEKKEGRWRLIIFIAGD